MTDEVREVIEIKDPEIIDLDKVDIFYLNCPKGQTVIWRKDPVKFIVRIGTASRGKRRDGSRYKIPATKTILNSIRK